MRDLMQYAAKLEGLGEHALPPVEKWNPEFCGDINLVIKSDGTWFYEGTPIGRARLVKLFSTVLKREGGKYFLVTPYEKLGIQVEDAPFIAVRVDAKGEGAKQRLIFTSNVADKAEAGPDHQITYRKRPNADDFAPYINMRARLEAKISRAVFYELIELGESHSRGGAEEFGVWSNGMFFSFGDAKKIFA